MGWTSLLVWLAFGLVLEGLLGYKVVSYLERDSLVRELWKLAHFHGAVLAVVNLVYGQSLDPSAAVVPLGRAASRAMVAGGVLLPLGFLLGGLWHFEGDPGIGIVLVPVGALLVLLAIGVRVVHAWHSPP
jgi:hypothetical protein